MDWLVVSARIVASSPHWYVTTSARADLPRAINERATIDIAKPAFLTASSHCAASTDCKCRKFAQMAVIGKPKPWPGQHRLLQGTAVERNPRVPQGHCLWVRSKKSRYC